jgi:phenylacetate-CoA ligase
MGKTYRNTYDFLEESEVWSKKEWDSYQRTKLREMMEYCYDHIPFYQKTFKESGVDLSNGDIFGEYQKLPFLTKKKVVEYSDQLVPQHIDTEKLYKASTGGTTGKPVTIYFDKDSYKKEWAFKIYSWNKAVGYTPSSRKASFRGVKLGDRLFYENPIYNEVRFSPFKMDDNSLSKISEKLLEYAPEFLHGYPSAIEQLTKYIAKKDIRLSIQGIMLVSENIYSYQVELFIDFDNENEVDELILQLIDDKNKLDMLGNEMAKVMKEKYTTEYMLSQFLKAING